MPLNPQNQPNENGLSVQKLKSKQLPTRTATMRFCQSTPSPRLVVSLPQKKKNFLAIIARSGCLTKSTRRAP